MENKNLEPEDEKTPIKTYDRRDLMEMYSNISYYTFKKWLDRVGLSHFKGVQTFFPKEVQQIFDKLGMP